MTEIEKQAKEYATLPMDVGEGRICVDKRQERAFIAGAHWIGKQVIAKLQFASDINASKVDREPEDEIALWLMQFSEAQIQQVLNLMRVDKPLYKESVLKEIGYVKPIK